MFDNASILKEYPDCVGHWLRTAAAGILCVITVYKATYLFLLIEFCSMYYSTNYTSSDNYI